MTEQEFNTFRISQLPAYTQGWILHSTFGVPSDDVSVLLDRFMELGGDYGPLMEVFGTGWEISDDGYKSTREHSRVEERPAWSFTAIELFDLEINREERENVSAKVEAMKRKMAEEIRPG